MVAATLPPTMQAPATACSQRRRRATRPAAAAITYAGAAPGVRLGALRKVISVATSASGVAVNNSVNATHATSNHAVAPRARQVIHKPHNASSPVAKAAAAPSG